MCWVTAGVSRSYCWIGLFLRIAYSIYMAEILLHPAIYGIQCYDPHWSYDFLPRTYFLWLYNDSSALREFYQVSLRLCKKCWELVGFSLPSRTPLRHNHTEVCLNPSQVYFAAVLNFCSKVSEYHKDGQLRACAACKLFKGGSCAEAMPYDWWGASWYLA